MRVLLVDHDSEGLEAVARAIRGVLELDCVTSKSDAMLLLRQNTYDVLIACERCVDGSGLDLLGRTTRTTAPLKRIFAAPADRLQLLGPRLAPFKVQRTISYPIDLEELWLAIAQVTGTHDDTDGTIERVVLDERGIPSNESSPRAPAGAPRSAAPAAPRAVAPTRETRAAPMPPAPAIVTPLPGAPAGARVAAAARMAQPAPEPPVRAPAPARPPPQRVVAAAPAAVPDTARPRATSDTGRMRALAVAPPAPVRNEPTWIPEPVDDFAQVAEQARLGVQRKAYDEASRRKRQRLITACVVAAAVAGVIVVLIEQFYDPEARAREKAIAAEVSRMAEQQKVTDNLTLIEVDIEKAIMDNDLDLARQELAKLVQQAPQHPRREFLQASIDRAAELARLAAQRAAGADSAGSARAERASRPSSEERAPVREPAPAVRPASRERVAERAPAPVERASSPSTNGTRAFGAPIGETPGQRTIPLNAPINAEPVLATQRSGSSFGGRTIEASDSATANSLASPASLTTTSVVPSNPTASGSAAMSVPPAAPAATPVPAAVDVTPAKLVKRVSPVPPVSVAARSGGFVVVKYNVTESGRVTDVEVVESSPNGVFDGAAQAAVRKWVYEPRKENGQAVASIGRARLVFEPVN